MPALDPDAMSLIARIVQKTVREPGVNLREVINTVKNNLELESHNLPYSLENTIDNLLYISNNTDMKNEN